MEVWIITSGTTHKAFWTILGGSRLFAVAKYIEMLDGEASVSKLKNPDQVEGNQ